MRSAIFSLLAIGTILTVLGCRLPVDEPTSEADWPFDQELLRAAGEYQTWGRVDDAARWAPYYCREPSPAQPRLSASADVQTHGQKLYSLFAKNRHEYLLTNKTKPATIGQVIVKQSFATEATADLKAGDADPRKNFALNGGPNAFFPFAVKGDTVYKAGELAGLFVMLKLDPNTPGTDEGWVYGTVTADGKSVTSAGMVESCMKCHREAKHNRIFGLPSK